MALHADILSTFLEIINFLVYCFKNITRKMFSLKLITKNVNLTF